MSSWAQDFTIVPTLVAARARTLEWARSVPWFFGTRGHAEGEADTSDRLEVGLVRCLAALLVVLALACHAQAEVLISAQEANLPGSPFDERGAFPGPKVVLVSPGDSAVASPIHLRVRFEPRGAKIDPDSLRVTYIKLEPVDLTERIRAFASVDGIDFKDAEVPPGTHKIRIELRDSDGVTGGTDIVLKITQ